MSSKFREAVEEIWSSADYIYSYPKNIGGVQQCARDIMEMIAKIKSEPLRNCDVGTAEEQYQRWDKYCNSSGTQCDKCGLNCNVHFNLTAKCFACWS